MEGLWYAHFTAGPVNGDGLAVLRHGEILGGDPSHTYSGSYHSDGPMLYANVRVSPYAASLAPSPLKHPLTFFLQGTIAGDNASLTGHADNKPDATVAVKLHRGA